jgi:flagellar protein FliS
LYDGLASSIARAGAAISGGDHYASNEALIKAQGIVLELQRSLKLDLWEGAPRLLSIYQYLYRRLIEANLRKDPTITAECLGLVEPLQAAWHRAAATLGAERQAAALAS